MDEKKGSVWIDQDKEREDQERNEHMNSVHHQDEGASPVGPYQDIIGLSRPHSLRKKMPMSDRAAQFSPFAALTGYDDVVKETARQTDRFVELGEAEKARLDRRFALVLQELEEGRSPELDLTWFQPDERKDGGRYVKTRGLVKRIDLQLRELVMMDGEVVALDGIVHIEGDLFKEAF